MLIVKKEILWKDVFKSEFSVTPTNATLLISWDIIAYSGDKINIFIGKYPRRDMRTIANALITRCPEALIDKTITNMAAGKFPWYIF